MYSEITSPILAGSRDFRTVEVEVYSREFASTILTTRALLRALNELLSLQLEKWALVYRASRDRFEADDFHEKCDGVTSTLTVIKTTNGNVFGGFTEKAWHSSGEQPVSDPNAYIFSLVNKRVKPFKAACSNNGERAIFGGSSWGPIFGGDHDNYGDIHIASNSNLDCDAQESYSELGYSYQFSMFPVGSDKANSLLAGSHAFKTVDIEVYTRVIHGK